MSLFVAIANYSWKLQYHAMQASTTNLWHNVNTFNGKYKLHISSFCFLSNFQKYHNYMYLLTYILFRFKALTVSCFKNNLQEIKGPKTNKTGKRLIALENEYI